MAWRVSAYLVGAEPRRAIAASSALFTDESSSATPRPGMPGITFGPRHRNETRNCLTDVFIYAHERQSPSRVRMCPLTALRGTRRTASGSTSKPGKKEPSGRTGGTRRNLLGEGRPYLRTLGKKEMIGVSESLSGPVLPGMTRMP
jgi:hypothetical protein